MSGHAAYRFAGPKGPARLDAALVAGEIDLDRFFALAQAATTSATFERPKEVALALDIGRTTYAGVEATKTHAVLDFDGTALKIERLSIADVGGAAVEASGRIDNLQAAGRGSLSLALIAGRLDGLATVAARLMPQAAEPLRKYESRLGPLKVTAKLDVEPAATGAASLARLKLTGKIAGIDTAIDATGTGNFSELGAAALRLTGRFDAEDGRVLAGFAGIDQLANMERRPARLTLEADGAFDRAFRIDAKFSGSDVSATAVGTLRGASDGRLDVSLRAADAKLPRRTATVPVDLRGKLALEKTGVKLDDLAGRIAGTNVKGRLAVALGAVPRVEGRIEADQVDGAELVAILAGAPIGRCQGAVVGGALRCAGFAGGDRPRRIPRRQRAMGAGTGRARSHRRGARLGGDLCARRRNRQARRRPSRARRPAAAQRRRREPRCPRQAGECRPGGRARGDARAGDRTAVARRRGAGAGLERSLPRRRACRRRRGDPRERGDRRARSRRHQRGDRRGRSRACHQCRTHRATSSLRASLAAGCGCRSPPRRSPSRKAGSG